MHHIVPYILWSKQSTILNKIYNMIAIFQHTSPRKYNSLPVMEQFFSIHHPVNTTVYLSWGCCVGVSGYVTTADKERSWCVFERQFIDDLPTLGCDVIWCKFSEEAILTYCCHLYNQDVVSVCVVCVCSLCVCVSIITVHIEQPFFFKLYNLIV